MRELHLFAGSGGGILGGMLLGHTCVCAVEIEPYCRKVLLQRQRDGILPKFPIWDDVRTFDGTPWKGKVDVVCGGFPCQDISVAGNGAGIDGERSGLWREMARIISEVRPRFAFVENSPALSIRGLGRVLGDFHEMGMDAKWGVISAEDAIFLAEDPCASHLRERLFILAYPNKSGLQGRTISVCPGGDIQMDTLGRKVQFYPTPTRSDYRSPNLNPAKNGQVEPASGHALLAKVGGLLNPSWVEWLMGWPIGWTELKPLEMDKFQQWLNSHGKH